MKKLSTSTVSLAAMAVLLTFATADAAEDAPGKKIFLDGKCNVCHSVKEADIKLLEADAAASPEEEAEEAGDKSEKKIDPPDLSGVGNRHTAEFIGDFLRKKEMIEGRKHRRRFRGTPEERQTLVDWLMTLKAKAK